MRMAEDKLVDEIDGAGGKAGSVVREEGLPSPLQGVGWGFGRIALNPPLSEQDAAELARKIEHIRFHRN